MPQALLSKREAGLLVGLHPEHLMKLARAGHFPRPIKIGASQNSATRFVAAEVEAWIAGKMAARPVAAQ